VDWRGSVRLGYDLEDLMGFSAVRESVDEYDPASGPLEDF
jgi:hypothetical protein